MRPDQQMDRSKTQVEGIKSLDPALTKAAPFSADQIAAQVDVVASLNARQEAAKAEMKTATRSLEAQLKRLREMTARNIAFFQGMLGKTDPRILKIGGKVGMPGRKPRTIEPPKSGVA